MVQDIPHDFSPVCVMQILNDSEARFNSADLNIAYKMGVDEYQRLCPYSQSLEANWGKAPGTSCAVLFSAVLYSGCALLQSALLCYGIMACCAVLWHHKP